MTTRAHDSRDQREFERANFITLIDSTIWRYHNISGAWECRSGPLRGHFADPPVLGNRSPLEAADALKVREIKWVSRLCTMMSLEAARADWRERGIGAKA